MNIIPNRSLFVEDINGAQTKRKHLHVNRKIPEPPLVETLIPPRLHRLVTPTQQNRKFICRVLHEQSPGVQKDYRKKHYPYEHALMYGYKIGGDYPSQDRSYQNSPKKYDYLFSQPPKQQRSFSTEQPNYQINYQRNYDLTTDQPEIQDRSPPKINSVDNGLKSVALENYKTIEPPKNNEPRSILKLAPQAYTQPNNPDPYYTPILSHKRPALYSVTPYQVAQNNNLNIQSKIQNQLPKIRVSPTYFSQI